MLFRRYFNFIKKKLLPSRYINHSIINVGNHYFISWFYWF